MKKFSTTLGLFTLSLSLIGASFNSGLFAADAGPVLAAPANGEATAKEAHSVLKPAEPTKANQPAAPASASLPAPEQITPVPMSVMPESKVAPSVVTPVNPVAPSDIIEIPDVHGAKTIPTAYEPDITYRERGLRKRCHDCSTDVEVLLAVKNPRTCCVAIVPVCVPCGCIDPTCISDRNALFCRGIVNYKYGNGFRIQMIFNAKGDVKVVYHYV